MTVFRCAALLFALFAVARAINKNDPYPQPRCMKHCNIPFFKNNLFRLNYAMSDDFFKINSWRPNPKKWEVHDPAKGTGSWDGRQPGLCMRENVWVQKPGAGNFHGLRIRARSYWKGTPRYNQIFRRRPGVGRNPWKTAEQRGYETFTTGMVSSKKAVLYGYFEVEARTMLTQLVNAWWFSSRIGNKWSEIDVFENSYVSQYESKWKMDMRRRSVPNAHFFNQPGDVTRDKLFTLKPKEYEHWEPIAFKSHTYGLLWTPETIVWYFDGKPFVSAPNTKWHQPLFVRFDVETNFRWHGILPNVNELHKNPRMFSVHYFRVYNVNWGRDGKTWTPYKWWHRNSGITVRDVLTTSRASDPIAARRMSDKSDVAAAAGVWDAMQAEKDCRGKKGQRTLPQTFGQGDLNFSNPDAGGDLQHAPYQGETYGKPVTPGNGMTWDEVIRRYQKKTGYRKQPKKGTERRTNYMLDLMNWAEVLRKRSRQ